MTYWTAPRLWPGETFAIIGGGKSLTREQIDACRGRCRVIAINDALRLCPWADVHYFCDLRWRDWHKDEDWYRDYKGLRVTLDNEALTDAFSLKNMGDHGIQLCPSGLATGRNGGIQAMNLAMHLGASRELLLGFDMKPGHWHGGHPAPTREGVYAECMLPRFPAVKEAFDRIGIEVINCTPGSALEIWPMADIRECLEAMAA